MMYLFVKVDLVKTTPLAQKLSDIEHEEIVDKQMKLMKQ